MKIIKKIVILVVIVAATGWVAYFTFKNSFKSQAAIESGVDVFVEKAYTGYAVSFSTVKLRFNTQMQNTASSLAMLNFNVNYDPAYLQLDLVSTANLQEAPECAEFELATPESSNLFDKNIVQMPDGKTKLRYSKAKYTNFRTGKTCFGELKFKVLKAGSSQVTINAESGFSEAYDSLGNTIININFPAGQDVVTVETDPSLQPVTPTPTVTPLQHEGDVTVAPSITPAGAGDPPTATPVEQTPDQLTQTPTPVLPITSIPDLPNNPNKVTIYLKIKLQAVVARPVGAFNKIKVGVAVGGGQLAENTDYVFNDFISQGGGVYAGVVEFNKDQVVPGPGYKILVKGPKHLAKRVCDESPNQNGQTAILDYFCPQNNAGQITLSGGINEFDFTKILMPAGDLPINGRQDSVVDATDLTFISPNGGSTDPAALRVGDVNFDGVIDTQDYVIILNNQSQNEDEG